MVPISGEVAVTKGAVFAGGTALRARLTRSPAKGHRTTVIASPLAALARGQVGVITAQGEMTRTTPIATGDRPVGRSGLGRFWPPRRAGRAGRAGRTLLGLLLLFPPGALTLP